MNRNELLVVVIAVALMAIPVSVIAYSVITNTAVSDLTYETETGFTVTVTESKAVASKPVVGNDTWRSDPLRLSSDGPASATVSDDAFDPAQIGIESVDATRNPVTINRSDLRPITLGGQFDQFTTAGIDTTDESPDFRYRATAPVTVSISGVSPTNTVAAVADGRVVATDSPPHSGGTATFRDLPRGQQTIRVAELPSELSVRDVTDGSLIDGSETAVTLTPVDADEPITRQITRDGTINMTGLPANKRFAARLASAGEYYDRRVQLPARIDQQPAYLLPADGSVTAVTPRLTLADQTGRFDANHPELRLQRPVPTASGTEYRTVAGEGLGDDGFQMPLQRNQQYRVVVVDQAAQQTHVTTVKPRRSEPTSLPIEAVQYNTTESIAGIDISTAYQRPESGDRLAVNLSNVRAADLTLSEAGNASNTLLADSYEQNVTADVPVPEDTTDSNWNADYEATNMNNATVNGQQAIQNPTRRTQREAVVRAVLSILLVVVLGSVAMGVTPSVGGAVIIITASLLWIAAWMPPEAGIPSIAVGTVVGVLGVITGSRRSP